MNIILDHIDSLSALSPFLPPVLKASLIVLICLVAYLPLSLLAWVLSKSFRQAILSLEDALEKLSKKALKLSVRFKLRASSQINRYYESNTAFISFEDVRYQFSGHSVQEALNALSETLQNASIISADREAKKSELIAKVNQNLENLSGGVNPLKNLDIPELELDEGQVQRKKSALSSLWLFVPLLVAVVIVNTSLLNTFFDDLLAGREILNFVPYSLVIAAMFTFIELGAGVAMGFQEREKEGSYSSGNYILSIFCWFIIVGLAMVEAFLYLLVGTSETYEEYSDMQDALIAGQYFEIFFAGGWLSILGPSIVLALYVFGHRVSTGLFDFWRENNFERFKNDLDTRFEIFQSMRVGIDDTSAKISELSKSVRKEIMELSEINIDKADVIKKFQQTIESQRSAIRDAVDEAEKLDIPSPEIQVQRLSIEDAKSFHRANLVYFMILLSSLVIITLSLPNEISLGAFVATGWISSLVFAMLFISLSVFSGMSLSTQVSLVSTSDGQLGKVIFEKTGKINLMIALGVFALNATLIYFIFSQTGFIENIIQFIFCLLSLGGAFFSGRHLLQAVSSWYVTTSTVWLHGKSLVLIFTSLLAISLAKIIAIIIPIFDSFSFPIRFVLRRS